MSTSDTTLLTEHLLYRPVALIDDVINSINILSFRATDAIERSLLAAKPSSLGFYPNKDTSESAAAVEERAKTEIENGVHQLETLLEAKIDKNFDKLELYALRNILTVPAEVRDWVRLAHYEGLVFKKEGEDEGLDAESILLLRRKLRETGKLHVLLSRERERNEATIRALRGLIGEGVTKEEDGEEGNNTGLKFLLDKGELKGDGNGAIEMNTSFALDQLPALRGLLQSLGERLKKLEKGGGETGGEKSWRRERLEFIEKETRRHLESERGLELGEMGEIRHGEWQGEGRRLGKGEVEDLEGMVGLVVDEDRMDVGK
ncbi:hypothetical protein B7494_g5993 [Chlorociboria aeruginascens]|nr:hypothetical protein B7494_g5993 [Chlorociboria aeruginascens]